MADESRPLRLHHHAFVCRDQETTRRFYEDVVGLPLVATWCEAEEFGNDPTAYCHTFFELADGSCLAFFQFADRAFGEQHAAMASTSPFDHVALVATPETQDAVRSRAEQAGIATFTMEHGYCRSLYLRDPDGLVVELAVDDPRALRDAAQHRARARAELERWLAGDHTSNNGYRKP